MTENPVLRATLQKHNILPILVLLDYFTANRNVTFFLVLVSSANILV